MATSDNESYARPFLTGTYPFYFIDKERIWFSDKWPGFTSDSDVKYGNYSFSAYLHEIGHSLGLSHPGTYNFSPSGILKYDINAEYAQDTRQNTIMSYYGGWEHHQIGTTSFGNPIYSPWEFNRYSDIDGKANLNAK